jgi:hypothetical protein
MDMSHIGRKRLCPEDWQDNERQSYYSVRAISHRGVEEGNETLDDTSAQTNLYQGEIEDLERPPFLTGSSTWNRAQTVSLNLKLPSW